MQKNALQPLALLLIVMIFSVALYLYPSVAQLRAAARAQQTAPQTTSEKIVSARVIYGPRRHQVRQRPVTETVTTPAADVGVVREQPLLDVPTPKSRLQTLLDESGARAAQRPLAEAVLSLLDPACLEKLQTFSVLYDNPKHRGLAGRGVILVSGTVPDQEFIGLLMHEGLGHFRDITCLTGDEKSGVSAFRDGDDLLYNDDPSVEFYRISWESEKKRKPTAARRQFVTGYAYESDNFEDLAESVTYFVTQEQSFRLRAASNPVLAKKLQWLETYMPKKSSVAEGNSWDGKIAWDATKLSFVWEGGMKVAEVK